jgi:hypothetical protein
MSIKTIGDEYITISYDGVKYSGIISGNLTVTDPHTVYLPSTTQINNTSLSTILNNKADISNIYLKTEIENLLNLKASTNNPTFTGTVSLPSTTTLNGTGTSISSQLSTKVPIHNPTFTGSPSFEGNIISPQFKCYSIANNIGGSAVFNGVGWLITNNYVFNGGTCLVNISANGFVYSNSLGLHTWTLQRSTNNGANYSNIGAFVRYFNRNNVMCNKSAHFIWTPGSVTVTNFRVLFTGGTDSNTKLHLTIVELPF